MLNHDFIRLKKLHLAYGDVHFFLQELADEFAELEKRRTELTSQLDKLRAEEKVIINNLEKELGREITPQDLLEIIRETDEI
jgi:cell division protein FtsB